MGASGPVWGGLVAFVAIAFAVDFFLFQRDHGTPPSLRRAVAWSFVWVVVAVLFGVGLFLFDSSESGEAFLTGYLLERSLSLDNVFVFALIFGSMAVPERHRQDVLELGIIIALVLRAAFIVVGAQLVESVSVVLYLFGAILLFTGIRMALHAGQSEQVDPDRNPGVRLLRRFVPITDGYREGRLTVREGGRRMATPLLAVVAAVATADVIFAVDSIPAIFGITTDTFIVFAANAFALLGLRALYALLAGAQDRFVHLPLGLAAILVFIGAKMLVEDLYHVPIGASLAFIVGALAVSVLVSLNQVPPGTRPVT